MLRILKTCGTNNQINYKNLKLEKMKKKISIIFAAIMAVSFVACNNDEIFIPYNEVPAEYTPTVNRVLSADRDAAMLRPFAHALYVAMSESQMLREIIRTRALEKFNKEYDVLYQFIKNEPVENGLTVRQLLLKHFESEEILAAIERSRPTLTIFVPELPNNSFSAELWNTEEQIPLVALHVTRDIHAPIIGDFGEYGNEFLLEAGFIPAFPVVVLRDNARVRVAQDASRAHSAALDNAGSSFVFEFTHEYFDNSKRQECFYNDKREEELISAQQTPVFFIDPVIQRAFGFFPNDAAGWQRDYIYYGLTPTNTTGRLSRDFKEHITSFRFLPQHTPSQILGFLTNHSGDPRLAAPSLGRPPSSYWTTGRYTFIVNAQVASTGALIPELTQVFTVYPHELFTTTLVRRPGASGVVSAVATLPTYTVQLTGFSTVYRTIPLMNWNLEQYAPTMRIVIFKKNDNRVETRTESVTAEFAGNVNWEVKQGLRFGMSNRIQRTATIQTVVTSSNLHLGTVLVDFGDRVVHIEQLFPFLSTWRFREYESSKFAITVRPVRVQ